MFLKLCGLWTNVVCVSWTDHKYKRFTSAFLKLSNLWPNVHGLWTNEVCVSWTNHKHEHFASWTNYKYEHFTSVFLKLWFVTQCMGVVNPCAGCCALLGEPDSLFEVMQAWWPTPSPLQIPECLTEVTESDFWFVDAIFCWTRSYFWSLPWSILWVAGPIWPGRGFWWLPIRHCGITRSIMSWLIVENKVDHGTKKFENFCFTNRYLTIYLAFLRRGRTNTTCSLIISVILYSLARILKGDWTTNWDFLGQVSLSDPQWQQENNNSCHTWLF